MKDYLQGWKNVKDVYIPPVKQKGLEMPDEEGGFATVTFSEGMLISVSYSFERSEDQWKEICDDFYQKWMIEGDEWPYIAEKEEVRVVLDYDKPNKEASLFLKRIE